MRAIAEPKDPDPMTDILGCWLLEVDVEFEFEVEEEVDRKMRGNALEG